MDFLLGIHAVAYLYIDDDVWQKSNNNRNWQYEIHFFMAGYI